MSIAVYAMMAVFNVDSRSGAHRGEWSPGNFVPDCWAAANFAGLDTGPRLRAVRFALIFGFRMARLCRLSPPFWHSSPAPSDTYWPAVALAWQFAGEQGLNMDGRVRGVAGFLLVLWCLAVSQAQ